MSPRPVFIVLSAILGFWGASSFLSEPHAGELPAPSASPKPAAKPAPLVRTTRHFNPAPPDPAEAVAEDLEVVESSLEDDIDAALNHIEDAGLEGGVLVVRVVDSFGEDYHDAMLTLSGCKTDLTPGAYEGVQAFGSGYSMHGGPRMIALAPGSCEVRASRGAGLLRVQSPAERIEIESGGVTRLNIQLAEEIGGMGFQLGLAPDGIEVVGLYRDSPAWDSDLQVGDVVTKIDGRSTEEMSVEEFAALGTGPIGEKVRLVVRREMGGSLGVLMKGIYLEREYLAEDLTIGDGLYFWE